MFGNMLNITVITEKPIKLFRGLKMNINSKLNPVVSGLTSVSTSANSAFKVAIESGGEGRFDLTESVIVILEIICLGNTQLIPNSLCTIYNEWEMLLCQSGRLLPNGDVSILQKKFSREYIDFNGKLSRKPIKFLSKQTKKLFTIGFI